MKINTQINTNMQSKNKSHTAQIHGTNTNTACTHTASHEHEPPRTRLLHPATAPLHGHDSTTNHHSTHTAPHEHHTATLEPTRARTHEPPEKQSKLMILLKIMEFRLCLGFLKINWGWIFKFWAMKDDEQLKASIDPNRRVRWTKERVFKCLRWWQGIKMAKWANALLTPL